MANRTWRSSPYQSYNQILTPMSYYQQPVSYSNDRNSYGGRGGYREDNYKRERKDFQSKPRDRFSPIKRRSPYQKSYETTGTFRKDSKKVHGRIETKVPKLTFDIKELSTPSLKFRYPKMDIPSDFFHTRLNAQEAFPLYRPIQLGNHCEFQVLNSEVEHGEEAAGDPEDVNYKFSAKVMLMTTPSLPELCKLTSHTPVNGASSKFGVYKNVKFLVGTKGKSEPMAIGGPWSPSLDGDNPSEDPAVLVRTAIRTCKALTGIDLSRCKKWFKFLDIHYYRPTVSKVDDIEKKNEDNIVDESNVSVVEVVTIFIPDVWSCVPSNEEWTGIRNKYEKKLQSLINPIIQEEAPMEVTLNAVDKLEEVNKVEEETKEMIIDEVKEVVGGESEVIAESALDLNQMKVTELRAELTARGLESKGLKLQLVERLKEAIEKEKVPVSVVEDVKAVVPVTEDVKVDDSAVHVVEISNEPVVPKMELSNQLPEKEQRRLEKLYKMNEMPSILVHSNTSTKDDRSECVLMSLESLLEYRADDNKEHTFEVSLFAEQFSEMVQRDAAFSIYKALLDLPDCLKESTEPDAKKARVEVTDDGHRKSKVMVDMNLLYSFCVFDCENDGYIRDHDLESILHCIGFNLSRSQVKKLLSKLPSKKGAVVYRDVVEREVVEGGADDVATLRVSGTSIGRLMELAQGNKSFFEEADVDNLATRSSGLILLDQLHGVELRRDEHELQLTALKDELSKLSASQNGAAEVEAHLRENIKKIQDKLAFEKEVLKKLSEVTLVYSELLKGVRDHMDVSIVDINAQFDHERSLAEAKAKEEADRAKEEADRIKEEADRVKEEADRAKKEAEKVKEDVTENDVTVADVNASVES